jgi:hypothetical protein
VPKWDRGLVQLACDTEHSGNNHDKHSRPAKWSLVRPERAKKENGEKPVRRSVKQLVFELERTEEIGQTGRGRVVEQQPGEYYRWTPSRRRFQYL